MTLDDWVSEHIMRALNRMSSPEEKFAALCKRYSDLYEEHQTLQSTQKLHQRRMTAVGTTVVFRRDLSMKTALQSSEHTNFHSFISDLSFCIIKYCVRLDKKHCLHTLH